MIAEALSRTVLLVKAELLPDTADEVIIGALRGTSVALVADEIALRTHAGQSAYVTAALLIARSGHEVILVAPNVRIVGKQPPLVGGRLIDSLMEIGADLLPGFTFNTGLRLSPSKSRSCLAKRNGLGWRIERLAFHGPIGRRLSVQAKQNMRPPLGR